MKDLPKTISEYETEALRKMPLKVADYVRKAAGSGKTNENNISAFDKYCIVPSVLRNLGEVDTTISAIGKKIQTPIMISPIAWQELYSPDKESTSVNAAQQFGTNIVISSFSTQGFEEIKKNCGNLSNVWYQTLCHKDFRITERYISKAKEAGVSAIVLLVDAPSGCTMCSKKKSPITGGSRIFPEVNSTRLPLLPMNEGDSFNSLDHYYTENLDSSKLSWDNIANLVNIAGIPVFLKGILNAGDAYKASKIGAKGIIISNHGGRQLDKAIPTLLALQNIRKNKDYGDMQIYLDGGLRSGQDVFIALALGADGVFIGRSFIYGLVVGGKEGIVSVLDIINRELAHTMQQAGCSKIKDITNNNVQVI